MAVEISRVNGIYDFRRQSCDDYFQYVETPLAQALNEYSDPALLRLYYKRFARSERAPRPIA